MSSGLYRIRVYSFRFSLAGFLWSIISIAGTNDFRSDSPGGMANFTGNSVTDQM